MTPSARATQPGRNGGTLRRGGGRLRGSRNKRTVIREILLSRADTLEVLARGSKDLRLEPRQVRLAALLKSRSHTVRVQAEKFLAEQEWGKATEKIEYKGDVTQRFVIETPVEIEREEWLQKHAAAEKAMRNALGQVN